MKRNEQKRERTTRDESAGATTDSLSRNCTAYGTQCSLLLVIFFHIYYVFCAYLCAYVCMSMLRHRESVWTQPSEKVQ